MNHTQQQQQQFTIIQQKVCALLAWDWETYNTLVEKTGKQYLQYYLHRDPQGIDMLVASKYYWSWWRTNWYQRDAAFAFQTGIDSVSKDMRMQLYLNLHDANTLAAAIYPNGQVLNHTYATMIGEVLDNKNDAV
ncbi:hypothetical protein [Limnovirga soli]|uniref:Uncharacterized protein n=1 Tax=Limnovirga soli TaxID=2656915 RepID=A0A8J8FGA7_9BACT|nr:hypothetical protein [Limnovirga soli]NNV54564.1 hypothetical protein [Limnovirga soli]